jgi:predicted MPP superfamily phosphohydrolase
VPLAFFGHTHGGQVRLPIFGAVATRSRLPAEFASGVFRLAETTFVINNGLGTSPLTPFRFLCRPEVTILELRQHFGSFSPTPIRKLGHA